MEKLKQIGVEEKQAPYLNGMLVLLVNTLLMLAATGAIIYGAVYSNAVCLTVGIIYVTFIGIVIYCGLTILKPNEAYVLTLFGKYYGTLKGAGFFFVNPFVSAINPATHDTTTGSLNTEQKYNPSSKLNVQLSYVSRSSKKISLKTMTLNNDKQKINDQLGNPIIIGIVVIWKVANTAKAVFNVDNYTEFLSIQCDSALRDIVRLYPYDYIGDENDNEKSLRGSSKEIAQKLRDEIQSRVEGAGLEIIESGITHLAYAPEIAAAMLQRQQASAIIDARQMIVDGAVGMVEMALSKLNDREIVHLDEERKAAMISNLLVVLCGNKEAQPIVNSGSIY